MFPYRIVLLHSLLVLPRKHSLEGHLLSAVSGCSVSPADCNRSVAPEQPLGAHASVGGAAEVWDTQHEHSNCESVKSPGDGSVLVPRVQSPAPYTPTEMQATLAWDPRCHKNKKEGTWA